MTLAAPEDTHTVLFSHATRKDWGVGVLAWELSGKRGYLFEDGEERTMASGFYELMGRVEKPSADQRDAYLRLQRVLAGRARAHHMMIETDGPTFYDQVARLRRTYPAGLLDVKWAAEMRGEGTKPRVSRNRAALIAEAQEQLNATKLETLLEGQHYGQVWGQIVTVLSHSDLVPKAQLKQPAAARGEHQRELAMAATSLLHGTGPYEKRLDRFLAALAAYSGEPARWEMATALSALVHPSEHVCVHPSPFRQQFKIIGSPGTLPAAKPSGAAYNRVLAATRNIAAKLAEQGEVLRDLLDVHDFIRVTLKAVPKSALKAKPQPKSEKPSASSEKPSSDSEDEQEDDD
ncbi:MAG TPA: hypothetical protein VIV60_18650 [Polyangiaceae bacterium]